MCWKMVTVIIFSIAHETGPSLNPSNQLEYHWYYIQWFLWFVVFLFLLDCGIVIGGSLSLVL